MTKVENAAQFMERICNDNSHGYSMENRWGEYGDYDCSSLVITCYEQAGVPVKSKGATYTGNMYNVFCSCGFSDVTSQCNLSSGSGLKRGDVLLNHESHTAMYLGNGKVGHARSSEGNSYPGDQNGQEIRIQSYWNYPWDCVLRYDCEDEEPHENVQPIRPTQTAAKPSGSSILNLFRPSTTCSIQLPSVKRGDRNPIVGMMQGNLKARGYDIGRDGADGDYGDNTERALKNFQKDHGLESDGVCDKSTWNELVKF